MQDCYVLFLAQSNIFTPDIRYLPVGWTRGEHMIQCATVPVPASSCSISVFPVFHCAFLVTSVLTQYVLYVDSCGDMRIFIVVRMQYVSHKVAKIIFFADRCESHVTKNIHRPLIFFTGPTVLKCCVGVASECDARRTKRQNDNCIYLDGN